MQQMDMFGGIFPEEKKCFDKTERAYKKAMKQAGNNYDERQAAEREHKKAIKNLTDEILKKDKKLKLNVPFTLGKVKSQLEQEQAYYVRDKIIQIAERSGDCVVCGNKILPGKLFVSDDRSGVCTCLECADPDTIIDNDNFCIQLVPGDNPNVKAVLNDSRFLVF